MNSCFYVGTVHHSRRVPHDHTFSYPLFMTYLDLDELDHVFALSPLWSIDKPNIVSLRRQDFLGNPAQGVKSSVIEVLNQHGITDFNGKICMLANLRYFGVSFNPVVFYYCFRDGEDEASFLVAEVHNTPWNERHIYVLSFSADAGQAMPCTGRVKDRYSFDFDKAFHVSPFNPMDMRYRWSIQQPGDSLQIRIGATRHEQPWFSASLQLSMEPMTRASMAGILIRFPLMTLKVLAGIYWQALRLWVKKTPIFDHPASTS